MKNKIILYSTGCPKCNVLIQKLNTASIDFETSQDMDIIIEKGFTSVPVLQIDDEFLDFKAANEWINEHSGDN
jgi:glutaredoxin